MSRIGKQIINIPDQTEVTLAGQRVTVKGPQGTLLRDIHPALEVTIGDSQLTVKPKTSVPADVARLNTSALWGTATAHIKNMVRGVNQVFEKRLLVEGIGYKVNLTGDQLIWSLGFSHPVKVKIPTGLKVVVEKNLIIITGPDKERLGEYAARLRALKPPEPYKGKGIRYENEVIHRKQGKKVVA